MCCTLLAENTKPKMTKKNHHLRTIAQLCRAVSLQLRHVSTIRKNFLKSSMSSTCPHNVANFGPLTAEIGSRVWGTTAKVNGCRVLPSSLQRRRSSSLEANRSLHDVWPSPGVVHYVYISGALALSCSFAPCKIHCTSKSCVLLYWQHYSSRQEEI